MPKALSHKGSGAKASDGEEASARSHGAAFPVVGVGASAGGLEALTQLLKALPRDTGMAFVIVQHLSPEHASSLAEILARSTAMPVCEVRDEPVVEADHVYIIPPGRDMVIAGGKLRLLPQERRARHRGIDQFFRSLAEDSAHLAIGIVLSGGASDGTVGIEEIKAAGGITFAQDASAQHESMPQSAAASGCVDFVLSPEKIAAELARIAQHPYVAGEREATAPEVGSHARITLLVHRATGVDFTHYKASTLQRRIARRMLLHKLESMHDYEEHLRKTPGEAEALYSDVLISVTSFFRNPDAFEVLAEKIFPALLAGRSPHEPVRVWSLGCSTGEEAYSLAMLFVECAEAAVSPVQLQVFATDLNAANIERARAGLYPRSIAADVSPERLQRFFTEEEGGYRIAKAIRERCVFSRHNVLADPPFSRVDFISCRNLLIYLEPVLQQQIFPLLHYALKPGGYLWLGSSESTGAARALFESEDARHKIFARKPGSSPPRRAGDARLTPGAHPPTAAPVPRETPQAGLQRDAERALVARFAPPGVVISAAMEIVQYRGETGAFLAPAAGAPSLHLLKMLREGLLVGVRAAIVRAGEEGRAVREEGLRVRGEGGFREVAVEVLPIKGGAGEEGGFVVLFEEGATPLRPERVSGRLDQSDQSDLTDQSDASEIARLTAELAATREYLQSVIEEQEAANEELQSANEEAQSANEELQSVNEELETSKEEIQSASEELATVNDELNNRNVELSRLNNDLTNVHLSTRLPMLILGRDLRIRRFTPAAEKTLGLAAADLGRPLEDTKLSMVIAGLAPLLHEVIATVSPRERDVQDAQGRWFSLRARPYQTLDNRIDGAVVTLVDIDDMRRAADFADNLLAHAPVPVLVLDAALRVQTVSHAFYETFRVTPAATLGRLVYELGNHQWDIPALRTLLEEVLPQESAVANFEVRHTFEEIGPRTVLLNARRLSQHDGGAPLIVLSIEDISARRKVERALSEQARLLDLTNDAIFVRNMEGGIEYWNAGAEKLYGWPREEALGQVSHELLKTESAVPFEEIAAALERDEHWTGEFLHTRRDGGRIIVLVRKSLDRDHHGQPVMVLENVTDITERKAAEAALRASEEFKRSIIESSPDCIKVLDLAGRLLSLEAGRELLGLADVTPLLGQPWMDFWKDGEQRAAAQAAVATAAAGGEGHFVGFFRTFDGHDKWWDVAISPIRDAHGQPARLLAVSRDVTERRAAEQAVRESDERFRMLADAINQLAWIARADGHILWYNQRWYAYTGTTPAEMEGWGWQRVHDPAALPSVLVRWQASLDSGEPFDMTFPLRGADGVFRPFLTRVIPMKDAEGRVMRWFGTNTDVSELKRIEAALAERAEDLARADRSKDEFLAMLAHELRNPLAPLRNASEILKAAGVSTEERDQAQRILARSIENMSRMIDDLLDVSRITEGKITLRKKPVALEAILTAAASMARSGCAAHGQDLQVTLPTEPVWLDADATRLEQVFNNLLGNACKYSGDGSHITLTAEVVPADPSHPSHPSDRREVLISVKDDGTGIDPELLPRVFDLFVQATRALDRAHGGLGIGLTLVQRLVRLHGGTITAHSDGLDQGAEFTVHLPILREAPPPPPPPVPVAQEVPRRILIVDDNTDSARSLAILQKRRGHETRTAFTGPDAVTAAAAFLPEVVLLDIGLPGMDGFEVARQIRAMPGLSGVFIIAMSGYGRDEDRAEATLAGFDEYLVKPVDLEQLRDWLRTRK